MSPPEYNPYKCESDLVGRYDMDESGVIIPPAPPFKLNSMLLDLLIKTNRLSPGTQETENFKVTHVGPSTLIASIFYVYYIYERMSCAA